MTSATKTSTPVPPNAPVAPGQRADARRNHEAIRVAARELFAERGIEVGMDEIARAAGVGVGTVYRHFPTKDDLITSFVGEHFARLAAGAAEALEKDGAWEAFRDFITWSAQIAAEDRVLGEFLGSRPNIGEREALASGLPDLTEKLIRKAQRQGGMRKDIVVEDVPTMVCGLGAIATAHPDSIAAHNWERFLQIALDGMRACPGTSRLPAPDRHLGDR